MSIEIKEISGIVVAQGEYGDICAEMFSTAQKADVEGLRSEKQRRERGLVYTLINCVATEKRALTDRVAEAGSENGSFVGAILGHRSNGAPFLECNTEAVAGVEISVSHCRSGACIAIGRQGERFGIDIEDESDKLQRVREKFVGEDESAIIGNERLLLAWTIKESVYKAAGIEGLGLRDGIKIKRITESCGLHGVAEIHSEIEAGEREYRGISVEAGGRCVTLSVEHGV